MGQSRKGFFILINIGICDDELLYRIKIKDILKELLRSYSINYNIYEFSCGEQSGWMYEVNGVYPGKSCSKYDVEDGDIIKWNYTCKLGKDLEGE